jgi:hypothetical protein
VKDEGITPSTCMIISQYCFLINLIEGIELNDTKYIIHLSQHKLKRKSYYLYRYISFNSLIQSMISLLTNSERVTNHDVKAVEYFIKKKFDSLSLSKYKEYIHFGLTSQDINNTAIPLSIKVYIMIIQSKSL